MKDTSKDKTHKIVNKKSLSRIALQTFVWLLVIAFVSTIGVMWDDQGMGFPVVLESSKGNIDLSPRNLYMLEYDSLDNQFKDSNAALDPRVYTRYLQNIALTNTIDSFTRSLLYKEIGIKASLKRMKEIQDNTGLTTDMIEFQYAENYYRGSLGILPIFAAPTVSDMYVIDNLQKFNMVTEILVLNKTNFLLTKVSEADKIEYYNQNFINWLDRVTVQDFKVENRGQARRIINMLKERGTEETITELNSNEDWKNKVTINNNLILTAQKESYTHLMDVLKAYKNKTEDDTLITTEPIYNNGDYHVSVFESILSFDQLDIAIQRELTTEYLTKNYNKILKEYRSEWDATTKTFNEKVSEKVAFAVIANEVSGAVHHMTQPFGMLQKSITNTLGAELTLPILTDPLVLKHILETPETETSPVIEPKFSEDLLLVIRPVVKFYDSNVTSTEILLQDQNLQRNIFAYKQAFFQESLNSELLKKRYNIKVYPEVLTNLNPTY